MRRCLSLLPLALVILVFTACDTGVSSTPENLLIGTWKRETDIAVYEITFTDTEYIYKVTYSEESGRENINTTREYISNGTLFSVFHTESDIYGTYVAFDTWYYYIKGDKLLISNFKQTFYPFDGFNEYQKVR
jgi:hypothetical protein